MGSCGTGQEEQATSACEHGNKSSGTQGGMFSVRLSDYSLKVSAPDPFFLFF
jgi:hypothetical protein